MAWSIERSYFPSLIERRETFVAYVYDGYWIDIGTPEKYTQVHRDIMDGRYVAAPFDRLGTSRRAVSADARIEEGAILEEPCFIDEGALVKAGARVGPYSVVGRQTQIEENAIVEGAIIWPNCRVSRDAEVRNAILGRQLPCRPERHARPWGGSRRPDDTDRLHEGVTPPPLTP